MFTFNPTQGFKSSNKEESKDADIDMFKFKESGIKVPMPNIEISESEIPGWDNVNILKSENTEKKKSDLIKTEEQIQLIKALEDIKQFELAYQKNSEELALEKKQHAKTIEDSNKLREAMAIQSEAIDTLKKNIDDLTKQKEEACKSADESMTLLKSQDDFIAELRRRLDAYECTKERLSQTVKELSKKNESLHKNWEESKKQLSTLASEFEHSKKTMQEEINKKTAEIQRKENQIERAREKIFKLESQQTRGNSQSVLYPSRKKEEEKSNHRQSGRDAGSKSIIYYRDK